MASGDSISRGDLRDATLAGVRWVALGRVGADTATLVSSVVLARLISPAEFGAFAIALVLTTLAFTVAAQGFGAPLIQRRSVDKTHLETAMLLSLLSGITLSATSYVAAPLSAPLFGERTADMFQLASPMFLIVSLGVVSSARLQRRLDFRRTAVIELASVLGGTAATLSLALAGLDAEALVLGLLCKAGISSTLLLSSSAIVVPRWNRDAARAITRFGGYAAAGSVGYAGFRNVDYAIVGAQLGAAQVGFYWRAYQLCFEYPQKITNVMQRIAFPVLSRSKDLADMRALRYRIVRVHTVAIFPVLFFVIATAPILVPWLFGQRWEPAVTPVQILGFAALNSPLVTGTGPLLLAAGKARELMTTTWAFTALYVIVILLTAPHGIEAVCFGVLGFQGLKFFLIYYLLLRRFIAIELRQIWRETAPALVAGLALLGVALGVTELLDGVEAPSVLTLVCAGVAGSAVYLAVLRLLFANAWGDLALVTSRVMGRTLSRTATPAVAGAGRSVQSAVRP